MACTMKSLRIENNRLVQRGINDLLLSIIIANFAVSEIEDSEFFELSELKHEQFIGISGRPQIRNYAPNMIQKRK